MGHDSGKENVVVKFDEIARDYDSQRRKLIPCFDDFYTVAASIADTQAAMPNILDIGAGTGLFAAYILNKYPDAKLTLIDISENMLDIAKQRFDSNPNVKYINEDYSTYDFDDAYDMVVSSLSIHHLTDQEKQDLYVKIYDVLNPQGCLVNADQVLGATPFLESLYKNDWKRKVELSGLSENELAAAYDRTKLDKMSTLSDQLHWLKEIGFRDVDCVYKYFNFAVLFGRK